jgi:hypothetical protein
VKRLARFKPSPSMVVALIALFVAMGGVGYAAATIGSAQIKNNSIRGKDIRNSSVTGKDVKNSGLTGKDVKNSSLSGGDVKNNSLTGNDLNESTLGTVPSANSANSANRAGSSARTDQVRAINFPSNSGDPVKTILSYNGLTLKASCDDIDATTTEAHSFISTYTSDDDDQDEDLDFNPGETFDLDQGHSSSTVEHYNGVSYSTPSGKSLTMYFTTVESGDGPVYPGTSRQKNCLIVGTAVGS